jgi:hypothetical protein
VTKIPARGISRFLIPAIEFALDTLRQSDNGRPTTAARARFGAACGYELEALEPMKLMKILVVSGCVTSLLAGPATAADKAPKKLTCCEQAAAQHKECSHKCCVTAHKEGKSCEKCNPNKEDLKFLKKAKAPTQSATK